MKIPAVALAAAFAGGIVLGQCKVIESSQRLLLFLILAVVLAALSLAALAAWQNRLITAATISLLCWLGLGVLASCLSQQPLPPEHVLSRIAAQQVPLQTPLRWQGVLSNEPERLPWGYGLDLELRSVETAAGVLPVTGGMRIGFTPHEGDAGLPQLRAGNRISIFTEAHRPLVYKDSGAFDRREFLARQNIHLLATLRSSKLLEKTGRSQAGARYGLARVRGCLRERLDAMFAERPEGAAILRAMLLGDRGFVDRAESVDFQKTGTFHVLVVAGLHVGALAVFLYWLCRRLRLPRSVEAFLILMVLLAYVLVVEQRTPVLRAGLTTAIVLLGSMWYRRLDLLNSAAVAALVLLIAEPKFITDSGFLLSFLAIGCIAGIAVPLVEQKIEPVRRALWHWRDVTRDTSFSPRMAQFRLDFRDAVLLLTSRLHGRFANAAQNFGAKGLHVGLRVAELFVVSCVLQFGMLALMARDFHRVSLLGPVVNVLVVPLTGVIVPLGFAALGLGTIFVAAAKIVALPLIWLVSAQHRVVSFFAAMPHASYRIPGPPAWLMGLFFAGMLGVAMALGRETRAARWHWRGLAVFVACVAVMIATYPFAPAVSAGELEVSVLDVGQGDSILVVSPKGSALLIDGGGAFQGFRGNEEHLGPDPGEEAVSSFLWSRGFQKLDAVALTHAHQDHIGGLTAVLENFRVGRLWLGRATSAPAFLRLKQEAERLRIPIEQEMRGRSFVWDRVQVDFLWPEDAADDATPMARNNDSLVVRLKYGERTILLPGDAEKQVEYSMLAENDPGFLHADVLKVGHHGSKNSTMPEFLEAVNPRISVISAGEENPYGHPHPALLQRLAEKGTRVLRTDRDGAVRILTDGHSLQVSCFVTCLDEAARGSVTAQVPDHDQGEKK